MSAGASAARPARSLGGRWRYRPVHLAADHAGTASGPDGAATDHGAPVTWSAQTRRDDGALDAVAGEWDDLYNRCPDATPFQSGEWIRSWWQVYGIPGRLRLVLVHRNGLLVAAAALTAHGRRPYQVLTPVGAGLSDFGDVLVDAAHAEEATRRLTAALLADAGWAVLRIPESRPGGAARRLSEMWPGPTWRGTASTCLEITTAPVPELLAALPGSTGKTLRKKLRKIDTEGFAITEVTAADAEDGIRALLALHRRQWHGREVNQEHLDARFERHLSRAAADMVRSGRAVIFHYRLADRLVASEVLLVGHGFAGAYLFGFDPELRERIDVAAMFIRQDLTTAGELGRPVLSLLRGDEPYKMRWRPLPVQNAHLVLGRPRNVAGVGYPAYLRARGGAVAVAKRLPWLHQVLGAAHRVTTRLRPRPQ